MKTEMDLLDLLMREDGVMVLDDYHLGMRAAGIRSRPLNVIVRALAKAWPSARKLSSRPGDSNEYVIVKQRLHGVARAVREFLEERKGCWRLEIVSMPSRGDYQGDDYSLAALSRT